MWRQTHLSMFTVVRGRWSVYAKLNMQFKRGNWKLESANKQITNCSIAIISMHMKKIYIYGYTIPLNLHQFNNPIYSNTTTYVWLCVCVQTKKEWYSNKKEEDPITLMLKMVRVDLVGIMVIHTIIIFHLIFGL